MTASQELELGLLGQAGLESLSLVGRRPGVKQSSPSLAPSTAMGNAGIPDAAAPAVG